MAETELKELRSAETERQATAKVTATSSYVEHTPKTTSFSAAEEGKATETTDYHNSNKPSMEKIRSKMGEENTKILKIGLIIGGIVIGIVVGLIVILVPLSFSDIKYYEMGFSQRKSTGEVDTSQVYTAGRHFTSLDYTFRVFPRDAHLVEFDNLGIFATPAAGQEAGRSSFELRIDVSFQYFLRPSELAILHSDYELQYRQTIINAAESTIKGVNVFTADQYFKNRTLVEEEMLRRLQNSLGGVDCCDSYCSDTRFKDGQKLDFIDCDTCRTACPADDQTFHVDVRYFQLKRISLPGELRSSFLSQIVELEDAQRETSLQDLAIVNANIDRDVQVIQNNATRRREEAEAEAAFIRRQATAESAAIIENARSDGLSMFYDTLNITDAAHKASFDYLRALRRKNKLRLSVGYSQAISGPFTT